MTPRRYLLAICRDGYARADDGFVYPRWALCLSVDGVRPVRRYRNGGPEHVRRTSAMKHPPDWQRRAVEYARADGVTAEDAGLVAEWFARHRDGVPPCGLAAK